MSETPKSETQQTAADKEVELKKLLKTRLTKKAAPVQLGDVSKWEKASPIDLIVAKKIGLDLDEDAIKRLNEDPDGLYSLMAAAYFKKEAEKKGLTDVQTQIQDLIKDSSVSIKDLGIYASKALTDGLPQKEIEKAWNNLKEEVFKERKKVYKEEVDRERKRQFEEIREQGILKKVVAIAVSLSIAIGGGAAIGSYIWAKKSKDEYYQKVDQSYRKKVGELEKKLNLKEGEKINPSTGIIEQGIKINKRTVNDDALKTTYKSLVDSEDAQKKLAEILTMDEFSDDKNIEAANLKNKINVLQEFSQNNPNTVQAFKADYKVISLYYLNKGSFQNVDVKSQFASFIKKYANANKLTIDELVEITNRTFRINLSVEEALIKTGPASAATVNARSKTTDWLEKVSADVKNTQAYAELSYLRGNILSGENNIIDLKNELSTASLDPRLQKTGTTNLDEIIEAYKDSEQGGKLNVIRGLYSEGETFLAFSKKTSKVMFNQTDATPQILQQKSAEALEGTLLYSDTTAKIPVKIRADTAYTLGIVYEELGMNEKAMENYTLASTFQDPIKNEALNAIKRLEAKIARQKREAEEKIQ
ncbi:hypothetical protein HY643_02065 [Candidatus Woesearchaeota archaeon]|nr:hypothetical protein [Candidatus Woesearchaeota archaeon]